VFFTLAISSTLGGVFILLYLVPLENEGLGGGVIEKSKGYFYLCMLGWNIKVLVFWSRSRSQGSILRGLWKFYKRRMKQYKYGGTFGDPNIFFLFFVFFYW
jgi:hypothetical protein